MGSNLSAKEMSLFKKDLIYFNEYIKNISSYDMFHLVRAREPKEFSYKDIYRKREGIADRIERREISDHLELYVHIPFCEEFCDYCVYYKKLLKRNIESTVEEYVDYLIEKIKYFAPAFRGTKIKALSVGGGTPSIMTPEQLKRLFGTLFDFFEFHENAYKGIEFRPSSTDKEKIKTLKELNFRTIHFGVQSLSQEVLENINRKEDTYDRIYDSIRLVRDYNFETCYVHLIRGLVGDTPEKFVETLKRLFQMEVDLISIYGLITTEVYIKKHFNGSWKHFYDWYNSFSEQLLEKIKNIAPKYGYFVQDEKEMSIYDHSWCLSKDSFKGEKPLQRFNYCDITDKEVNLFAFGPSGRSFLQKSIMYEGKKMVSEKFEPEEKFFIGNEISEIDDIRRKIVSEFRDKNRIYISEFKEKFNIDILEFFSKELEFLRYLGVIEMNKNKIKFLAEGEKMRLLYVMFFFGRKYISECFDNGLRIFRQIYEKKGD